MALPPLSNRVPLDQLLKQEFARIDEEFSRINRYILIGAFSAVLTVFSAYGVIATEEPGKKRTLTNKIFLGAGLVGAAATVCSLVSAVVLLSSASSSFNKV